MDWLPLADAFTQVDQPYLLEARQMQALSFGIHIPLVCFGVAFPAIVLFMEGLYHRTGNVVYRQIAKRWSKVMLILFAVGVVSGTILSFELGLLWPRFMEEFGEVFGVAFALEGLSFFIEAIFITIYVYGWDRISDRTHFLTGIPIVIIGDHRLVPGDLGQRLDEQPDRVRHRQQRGHQRATAGGAVQRLLLARVLPHVRGRVHRRRLPGGRRLRVRLAARQAATTTTAPR